MIRSTMVSGLLILSVCLPVTASTGVRVEGVFVRTGTFTPVTQVEVGQPVQLIVRVRDISSEPQGVAGGFVDVSWNSKVLELVSLLDNTNATENDVKALFNTATWQLFYTGIQVNAGLLQDMGAGQGVPPNLFQNEAEEFFTLDFMPIATGSANVSLVGHDFGLIVTGQTEAAAQVHEATNPTLSVVKTTGPTQPTNNEPVNPTPAATCFGPALAVGLLMAGGCSRTFSGRRRRH